MWRALAVGAMIPAHRLRLAGAVQLPLRGAGVDVDTRQLRRDVRLAPPVVYALLSIEACVVLQTQHALGRIYRHMRPD
eukprot:SAG25_NODE_6273_length_573_cov_0.763713_1_plen_77_part_10